MTRRVSLFSAVLLMTIVAAETPAVAQMRFRPYAGASVGSFSISADEVDGRSVAAGFFGGFSVSRYVDAELEVTLPAGTFTRSYTGPSVSFAPPGSSARGSRTSDGDHAVRQRARGQRQYLRRRRHPPASRHAL